MSDEEKPSLVVSFLPLVSGVFRVRELSYIVYEGISRIFVYVEGDRTMDRECITIGNLEISRK